MHLSVCLQEVSSDLDGAPMDSTDLDGLPLDTAPVDDLDGCPLGWDPLDGVPVDDIDGVPLGAAIDSIDGIPCESTTTYSRESRLSTTSAKFSVPVVKYLPNSSVLGQYTAPLFNVAYVILAVD